MASFTTTIDLIKTTLQNDAALASFCSTKWNKTLMVKDMFKRRTEINQNDFPIILMTNPSKDKSLPVLGGSLKQAVHVVRLYYGFMQRDKRKAMKEMIEYDELIEDAIRAKKSSELGVTSYRIVASENDEGMFHPVYFGVMDIEMTHRR